MPDHTILYITLHAIASRQATYLNLRITLHTLYTYKSYPTMPCHSIACHHAIAWHTIPCHIIPYHATPHHTIPYHYVTCHWIELHYVNTFTFTFTYINVSIYMYTCVCVYVYIYINNYARSGLTPTQPPKLVASFSKWRCKSVQPSLERYSFPCAPKVQSRYIPRYSQVKLFPEVN